MSKGIIDGVNVDQLIEAVEAIKATPSRARFRFRAKNAWIRGGHNVTTVKDFYGAGREDSSRRVAFELHADEPAALFGDDQAANPIEYVLAAVASCLTTSLVYHGAVPEFAEEAGPSRMPAAPAEAASFSPMRFAIPPR